MAAKPPGVFCFEGEWEGSIESRVSIEPVLRLLESRDRIRLVHRDVATIDELQYCLDRWLSAREGKEVRLRVPRLPRKPRNPLPQQ
jgi:hypothetical protein